MLEKIKECFRSATKGQWIRGIIASVLYILFIIWHGNYWWFLLLPVIFDAFVTKFIPWGWWKNIKNKTLRSVMGWVDAIIFALIGVYFIFNYFFQNYQIPTSSLEKTLLVGDFLFVSKATYGPRIPMTPLHFPLAQHTMPIVGGKSYFDKLQWDYRRLKGFRDIKLDDIVVFNFPTGDTVALKMQNPDYYTLVHYFGRDAVWNNPQRFGEIIYRPVDRRENYVKRCVGLPGTTVEMRNNQVYVDGVAQPHFPGIQHNYYVQTDGTIIPDDILTKLGISNDDRIAINPRQNPELVLALQYDPGKPIYQFPLTEENLQKMRQVRGVTQIKIEPSFMGGEIFPLGANTGWDRDNSGPLYIPKKGDMLTLNLDNLPVYERLIRTYEHNKLEVRDSVIYINDVATNTYQVKMDYYWMLGDNRHKSADSRYWGFVPEDHIVGRPVFVWLSLDKDKSGFGKIRWNRFFKDARR